MPKATAKNYSAEVTKAVSEKYEDAINNGKENPEILEELAEEFEKTPASIRSKLVSLGIYRSKTAEAASKKRVTKEMMAADIAANLFGDSSNTQGLENCNAAVLRNLLNQEKMEAYVSKLSD